ncbi:hypothetical protein [Dokdonella sp.]|uniref:hypothetical protein n=1 Tax=Dokdonella sp. TaxID=2291710 RepID=UPI00352930B4
MLVYAALDGGGSSWTECKDQYFNKKDDARSRYGSPLWADDLLSGMPRTFNVFGQYESSRAPRRNCSCASSRKLGIPVAAS